jgi:hypothetical protein
VVKEKGGGILITIKEDIYNNIRSEDNNLEALCIEVKLNGNTCIFTV